MSDYPKFRVKDELSPKLKFSAKPVTAVIFFSPFNRSSTAFVLSHFSLLAAMKNG